MNPAFVGVVDFILRDFISISVLKKLKRRKHFGREILSRATTTRSIVFLFLSLFLFFTSKVSFSLFSFRPSYWILFHIFCFYSCFHHIWWFSKFKKTRKRLHQEFSGYEKDEILFQRNCFLRGIAIPLQDKERLLMAILPVRHEEKRVC